MRRAGQNIASCLARMRQVEGVMEQKKRPLNLHRIKHCWGECLEVLGLSEAQSFQVAGVPFASSFLHLEYDHLDKLLRTFNLSLELLDEDRVCRETLTRQFRGEAAFSRRALGNQGSRPELILEVGSYLNAGEFGEILSSFQLSKALVSQSKTYLSAEIVDILTDRICENRASYCWVESSSVKNYRQCFGNTRGDSKSFSHLVDNQMKFIERNFSYKIEKLGRRKIVFSCVTNEKTRHYLQRNLENYAWLLNIKYFCQCYFGHDAEIKLTQSTLDGGLCNRFEVTLS